MNYKLIYEKDGKFYGSETGIPATGDHEFSITRAELESYGLVYSVNGQVMLSVDKLPSEDDIVAGAASAETETVTEAVVEDVTEEVTDEGSDESTDEIVEDENVEE